MFVECDDKFAVNQKLKKLGLPIPESSLIKKEGSSNSNDGSIFASITTTLSEIDEKWLGERGLFFPMVVKPRKGRGSQGVSVVQNLVDLKSAVKAIFDETEQSNGVIFPKFGSECIVERYLSGKEITVAVMPPGKYIDAKKNVSEHKSHWSLPIIERSEHKNGVMPYSGVAPVSTNSRPLILDAKVTQETANVISEACAKSGVILGSSFPMRIDCRFDEKSGVFFMFDVNPKPNLTATGRNAKRANAENLASMSARAFGWPNEIFLYNIIQAAWDL